MEAARVLEPGAAETLESLMDRYAAGSAEAFNDLYRRVAPKLFGYLIRVSRDPALAEDVLQMTFAKVHRARHAYLSGSPFVPWLLVIARRTFLDERRSAAARWEVLSDDGVLPELEAGDAADDLGRRRDIDRALAELPPQYREAIELTKLAGLSGNEAARVLETTKSAVKLRVHRGYHLLRRLLEPEDAGLEVALASAAG
jgi:RNA polymerase sigma-70 factor (ECF subfamily)